MEKVLEQIKDFVLRYKIKPESQFKKILEEIEEYNFSHDQKELADIVITCVGYIDIINRCLKDIPEVELPFGLYEKMDFAQTCVANTYKIAEDLRIDLPQLIREKVEINENRTWEVQKGGILHHV